MKKNGFLKNYFILFLMAFGLNTFSAENHYPAQLLHLNDFLSHHILVAEKSTHKLYLFENSQTYPKLIKTYQMATGKKSGDKIYQGDHRTPEGIFVFTRFIPRSELIKTHGKKGEIYGIGSFVMDYPNPIDNRNGKTGGGIWLHSTNDETRIDKGLDSRGCIVIANDNLKDVSKYIEINKTKVIVVHDLHFLNKINWDQSRNSLLQFIQSWQTAWANENIKDYRQHYHPTEFYDPIRGNFNNYITYKKNVFWAPGKPKIQLKDIDILQTNKYASISFIQNYKSKAIQDTGKKTLYLKMDEYYNWKIVAERWSKTGLYGIEQENDKVAFRPSNRFFNQKNTRNN